MGRTLLMGGCVLSLDRKVGNFRRADVLIENDLIAEVGESIRARDAEVIDATDTIVMPGFVDTHRHLWESLFRGSGSSVAPAGSDCTADDVYAATLIGLLGAAEAGITTVVDWSEVPSGGAHRSGAPSPCGRWAPHRVRQCIVRLAGGEPERRGNLTTDLLCGRAGATRRMGDGS